MCIRDRLLYRLFDGHDLPLLEGTHEYLLLLAAPCSLTMEDGHPALQLVDETVQYGAGLFSNDIGDLGAVHAIEYLVDYYGRQVEGDDAIQGAVQALSLIHILLILSVDLPYRRHRGA